MSMISECPLCGGKLTVSDQDSRRKAWICIDCGLLISLTLETFYIPSGTTQLEYNSVGRKVFDSLLSSEGMDECPS